MLGIKIFRHILCLLQFETDILITVIIINYFRTIISSISITF